MNHHRQTRIHLQQRKDWLRAQNRAMIQALASPSICRSCTGSDVSTEESELRLENALLRSELNTLTCFTARLNSCRSLFPMAAASATSWHYAAAVMTSLSVREVISLARQESPMWITNERLNLNEYYSRFFPWYARNVPGFVHDASRASSLLSIDASWLVTTLLNPASWQTIFPSIVADVSMELHHHGFQMINVDFMPQISSFVQIRNVKLLQCSKHMENTWVIAYISGYFSSYARHSRQKFMRFPSGFLVQHIANGLSKVTIIDHWVYKEEEIINNVNPNSGFGAQRWLAALQRHCFVPVSLIGYRIQRYDPIRHTNLLNLSTFMIYLFCTGVCGITGQNWRRVGTVGFWPINTIRMFTRESRDMSGAPYFLVSTTGLARMQARQETIFNVINRARKQDIWNHLDFLGDMKEVIRIRRSPYPGNDVSVFNTEWTGSKEWYLIQETYFEASGAMVIHACVEAPSLEAVMNGGDLSRVQLLPFGFTIMPHRLQGCAVFAGCQVKSRQAIVVSSDQLVSYLKGMVTETLENVQNTLPVLR